MFASTVPGPTVCPRPCFTVLYSTLHLLKPEGEAPLSRGAKPRSGAPPLPRLFPPRPADSPGCAAGPPAPCDNPAVPRSRAGICPPRGSFQPEFPGSDTQMSRARTPLTDPQISFPASSKSRDIPTGVFA